MEPLSFKPSKSKHLRLLVTSLLFVGVGAWMLQTGERPVIGAVGTLFFATSAILAVVRLRDSKPLLWLDQKGLYYRTGETRFFSWNEIESTRIWGFRSQEFVYLKLKQSEFPILLASIDLKAKELTELIEKYKNENL